MTTPADISKEYKRTIAERTELIRDMLDPEDDDAIWEYLNNGGDVHILYSLVGEKRVDEVKKHAIMRILHLPRE